MGIAPLFFKYQTRSGNFYVYDPGTNEIVRTNEVVYRILDDFRILDTEEMVEKHRSLGEADVREALRQLGALQSRGLLADHTPRLSSEPEVIIYQDKEEPLEDFLRGRRRHLILEITEKCNLRCAYCVYGDHYEDTRGHGTATMTLETAKKAIRDFVDHRPSPCSMGFYGGEPLLEFGLLKQIVSFAQDLANERGLELLFNITTNGTLLNDEAIHFLVENEFNVSVSLDGNKEDHDRYRVFRDEGHPERRKGSYDVIMKNLKRFADLYPDSKLPSIMLTLTATSEFDKINESIRQLGPYSSYVRPNYVRRTSKDAWGEKSPTVLRLGSFADSPCEERSCRREVQRCGEEARASGLTADAPSEQRQVVPEFLDRADDRDRRNQEAWERFLDGACTTDDTLELRRKWPLFDFLLRLKVGMIHRRVIRRPPVRRVFRCSCFPGAARTFYSARGVIYSCERTSHGTPQQLGDVDRGIDMAKAVGLVEATRLLADCGNCAASTLCSLCPARLEDSADSERPDPQAFQEACRRNMFSIRSSLIDYTTLMETNRGAAEELFRVAERTDDDWLGDLRVGCHAEKPISPEELGVEELEEWADEVCSPCEFE